MKLFRFELQNFVNNRKKAWFFHFFRCRDWVLIRGHTFSLLTLNFCKMWTNYVSRPRVCFGMENNALRWLKWYFRKQCTPVIGEKLNSKSIKNADFWWYPRLVGLITGTASEDSNFGCNRLNGVIVEHVTALRLNYKVALINSNLYMLGKVMSKLIL